MAILYSHHSSGEHVVKFASGLILGWIVETGETTVNYALFSNGRVLKSAPISIYGEQRHYFDPKGCKWSEVSAVPSNAEFIGHYKAPRNV